jgi:hypothetical protein
MINNFFGNVRGAKLHKNRELRPGMVEHKDNPNTQEAKVEQSSSRPAGATKQDPVSIDRWIDGWMDGRTDRQMDS